MTKYYADIANMAKRKMVFGPKGQQYSDMTELVGDIAISPNIFLITVRLTMTTTGDYGSSSYVRSFPTIGLYQCGCPSDC